MSDFDITYEIKLAEQARTGSKEAFCELYGIYKDRLYRYALYRLGDPDDAEDAVSECILAAWQSVRQLRNTSAFGAWLFRILRNCCVRKIKGAIDLRENMQQLYDVGAASSARAAGSSDPSAAIELAEALSQLSDDEREVVLLSAVCGLTSREISEITGLTAGASRSKLSRSLSKMRSFLS